MGSSTGRPLQPLRIPQNWAVEYNQFFDVEPKFKTFDDVSWDFGEDILQLANQSARVVVSLGWYPSHKAIGAFTLCAVQMFEDSERMSMSWYHPLRELRTRSKAKVVDALERWLEWYTEHEPAAERQRRLTRIARAQSRRKS